MFDYAVDGRVLLCAGGLDLYCGPGKHMELARLYWRMWGNMYGRVSSSWLLVRYTSFGDRTLEQRHSPSRLIW